MAFAIAAGAPLEAGLYTAVVAGFAISALGGSRCQIGGPTGAFVVIIFGILARYGENGILVCTLMAGVILFVSGADWVGDCGEVYSAAGDRGVHQRHRDFDCQHADQGLLRAAHRGAVPGDFLGRIEIWRGRSRGVHFLLRGRPRTRRLGARAVILVIRRGRSQGSPGTSYALVAGTLAGGRAASAGGDDGSRFGGIPSGFPRFRVPVFDYHMVRSADLAGNHDCAAGGDRVVDVRGGRGPHERRAGIIWGWSWWRRGWRIFSRRCLAGCRRRAQLRAPRPISGPERADAGGGDGQHVHGAGGAALRGRPSGALHSAGGAERRS